VLIITEKDLTAPLDEGKLESRFYYLGQEFIVYQLFEKSQENLAIQACKHLLDSNQVGIILHFEKNIGLCHACPTKQKALLQVTIPEVAKLTQQIPSLGELLETMNHVYALGRTCLGRSVATKYLEKSRPQSTWMDQFQITGTCVEFTGKATETIDSSKIKLFSEWLKTFIFSCSYIIQDFSKLIENKRIRVTF
jgi:hypothetical protein